MSKRRRFPLIAALMLAGCATSALVSTVRALPPLDSRLVEPCAGRACEAGGAGL